jgi:hypothetical protein
VDRDGWCEVGFFGLMMTPMMREDGTDDPAACLVSHVGC